MGPVNWVAVLSAAALAVAIAMVWNGPLFRTGQTWVNRAARKPGRSWLFGVVFLLAAIMLGHSFARIGEAVLAAKPWLYFMQTGGVALFFVMPAIWLTQARTGTEPMHRARDCAFWLFAYLAMGAVFWVFG